MMKISVKTLDSQTKVFNISEQVRKLSVSGLTALRIAYYFSRSCSHPFLEVIFLSV